MLRTLILACGLVLAATPTLAQDGPWIISTDYEVFGHIESFGAITPWATSGSLSTVPSDAIGRQHDGLVYVVGRGGSNLIRIHDPENGFALVREFSIGAGRNPQDIVFDDQGHAFVPCYDDDVLLQVDVESGAVVQTFSTAAYADSDGLPETSWALITGGKLYVACQNLDRDNWYSPTGPGRLLVMDLATLQWETPVALAGANPYTPLRLDEDGKLLIGCTGYWAMADAGIESVDPQTGLSEGYVATESQLGGDVLNFVLTGEGRMHVLLSDASFTTHIVRFDATGGTATNVVSTAGYDLADLAFDGDFQLYVADRTLGAYGVRVFDTTSGAELTSQPIPTVLPPFQFVTPETSGPSGLPVAGLPTGSLRLAAPYPNPCNPRAELAVEALPNAAVQVAVYDLRGRCLRTTTLRADGQGRAAYRFEGIDDGGRALAAGLYRVVARGAGGFAARSVTLVK